MLFILINQCQRPKPTQIILQIQEGKNKGLGVYIYQFRAKSTPGDTQSKAKGN